MDKKYLNIPVQMLQELHIKSSSFFNNVFDVGIYLYSKKLEGNEEKRYRDSLKFFGIRQKNIKECIQNAKRVLNNIPGKYPIVGIEIGMLFDFYKNKKDPFEIIVLSAFLGIKSIIGTKPYIKTNKAHIHARMFGFSSISELPAPAKLNPLQKKYQHRWHMDKLLIALQTDWHLKMIAHNQRGMFISYDLTLDQLAMQSEQDKQKNKIKKIKELKNKAIQKAKDAINSTLTAH